MTASNGSATTGKVYASPAKLKTVLSLAMVYLDEAADIAKALGMTQRERAIRTLAAGAQRQKDRVKTDA